MSVCIQLEGVRSPARVLLACCLALGLAAPVVARPAGELPSGGYGSLREAERLFRSAQYRRAAELAEAALVRARATREPVNVVAGLHELLFNVYYESGRYDAALRAADRYRQVSRRVAGPTAKADLPPEFALTLSDVHYALEQLDQAAEILKQALKNVKAMRASDALWEARARSRLARIASERGEEDAAKSHWSSAETQALDALRQASSSRRDPRFVLAALDVLENCYANPLQPARGREVCERLLRKEKDDLTRRKTLCLLAECYRQDGNANSQKQSLQDAMRLQSRIDKQKPSADYAELLDKLGAACAAAREEKDALGNWNESARLYESLIAAKAQDDFEVVRQMQHRQCLQVLYYRLRKWADGARVSREILDYRLQSLAAGDPRIFRAKSALGAFLAKNEEYPQAKPLLDDAVKYWRKRTPPALLELAATLNNLAEVERATGNYTAAAENFAEALPVYSRALPRHDIRIAEIHANLATVWAARGQYKAAIDEYLRAEAICQQPHEPASGKASVAKNFTGADDVAMEFRKHEILTATLLNTAMLYKAQRQFEQAITYCEKALGIWKRKLPENDPSLLPFYIALGSLRIISDQPDKAIDLAEQCDNICRENNLTRGRQSGNVLHLRAMALASQGKHAEAKECWRRASEIATRHGMALLEAKCMHYLAELALRDGQIDVADDLSARALEVTQKMQVYPNLRFLTTLNRAQVLRRQGQKTEAIEHLEEAVRLIEAPRASTVGAEAERAEYFSQFAAAFDLLVEWNLKDGHLERALSYADAGRNRTFLDQVRAAGVDLRDGLREGPQRELMVREQKIIAQYNDLAAQIRSAPQDRDSTRNMQESSTKLAELRSAFIDVRRAIRNESPFYREVLSKTDDRSLWSVIGENVLEPDSVVLFYFLGQRSSYLFLIARDNTLRQYPLKIGPTAALTLSVNQGDLTRASAVDLVRRCLLALRSERSTTRGLTGTVVSPKSHEDVSDMPLRSEQMIALADILLPPAAREKLGSIRPEYVVVIPDGPLHQLPLEALLISQQPRRFLFDELPAVTYAPSAMIFAALSTRRSSEEEAATLLTVGDPAYPALPSEMSSAWNTYLAMNKGRLVSLPATRAESQRVAAALGALGESSVAALLGAKATEANVRAGISRRRFVHLAAHGLVDQQHENLFGGIALTPPPAGQFSSEDGFLSLYEIQNIPLSGCELAVLSACETNVGPERPLEAGSTMARAFLASGAVRVVSSHWNVDDDATGELVAALFEGIGDALRARQKPNYAQCLYRARTKIRKTARWSEPFYWAPLVLIGPAK